MIRDGQFRKAAGSETTGCVEVAADRVGIRVRDSKRPEGGELSVTDREWRLFVAGIASGRFDLPRQA